MNPQQPPQQPQPPYGQQPYPQYGAPQQPYGQQYPQQQWYPQGPPQGPPPKKGGWGRPVAILLVVAVLAAGGVFGYLKLVKKSDDGGGPQGRGGKPAPVATGANGQLEVNGHPIYNACNLLDHADVSIAFGRLGDGAYVAQSYADPKNLPPAGDDGRPPTWAYGLDSDCTVQAGEDAAVENVHVQVSQSVDASSIDSSYTYALDKQQHAPFSKDKTVEKIAGQKTVSLVWKTDGAFFQIDVMAAYEKPVPGDDKLAQLLKAVKARIASPDPNPRQIAISIGGYKVRDLCALWTVDDFTKTLKTPADPTTIRRKYPVASAQYGYESSCQRNNAAQSGDTPAPAGTSYLQGGINPEITTQDYGSAAAADAQYKDALEQGQFNAIGGMGAPASFGIYADAYEIVVRKDRTVLTVRLGSTVGTADYTPAQMQTLLTPVAKDILGKL